MSIRLADPLPSGRVTDRFGWRPAIPSIGLPTQLHNGLDKAAPAGTVIQAAHAGRVIWKGYDYSGGWGVQIDQGGFSTLYFHMREISPLVNVGQHVSVGQGIGHVGSSGAYTTGPHLHFMLRIGGQDVNPEPYMRASLPIKPTPSEKKKVKKMANSGFYYEDGPNTIIHMICNTESGFVSEYGAGAGKGPMAGAYNNAVAKAFSTPSFAKISKGHAQQIKRDMALVRAGK